MAKKKLGADGDKLQVVFITLDPERDSPALLQQYVPGFDPSFVALIRLARTDGGHRQGLQGVLPEGPRQDPELVLDRPHRRAFVFDQEGRLRLFMRHGTTPDDIAADIRRLL